MSTKAWLALRILLWLIAVAWGWLIFTLSRHLIRHVVEQGFSYL